eukprot:784111-Rhodomonas_salina.1
MKPPPIDTQDKTASRQGQDEAVKSPSNLERSKERGSTVDVISALPVVCRCVFSHRLDFACRICCSARMSRTQISVRTAAQSGLHCPISTEQPVSEPSALSHIVNLSTPKLTHIHNPPRVVGAALNPTPQNQLPETAFVSTNCARNAEAMRSPITSHARLTADEVVEYAKQCKTEAGSVWFLFVLDDSVHEACLPTRVGAGELQQVREALPCFNNPEMQTRLDECYLRDTRHADDDYGRRFFHDANGRVALGSMQACDGEGGAA